MGVNPEKDALRKARTRQKIIETGFRVFAERTIDAVNLTDIARAAGLCITTVYSYFSSKEALVMEISVWAWRQYINENVRTTDRSDRTAAVAFDGYLESFIDLYRNHKDILRFNQFFNAYVQRESVGYKQLMI